MLTQFYNDDSIMVLVCLEVNIFYIGPILILIGLYININYFKLFLPIHVSQNAHKTCVYMYAVVAVKFNTDIIVF